VRLRTCKRPSVWSCGPPSAPFSPARGCAFFDFPSPLSPQSGPNTRQTQTTQTQTLDEHNHNDDVGTRHNTTKHKHLHGHKHRHEHKPDTNFLPSACRNPAQPHDKHRHRLAAIRHRPILFAIGLPQSGTATRQTQTQTCRNSTQTQDKHRHRHSASSPAPITARCRDRPHHLSLSSPPPLAIHLIAVVVQRARRP
jgi:hypothetical protein